MARKSLAIPAIVSLAAVLLSGCSSAENEDESNNTPRHSGEMLRASYYDSVAGLTADSDLVARVRATDKSEIALISGTPFTITDVEVTEAIRGKVPPALRIRQTGGPTEPGILTAGESYLLFLDKFELPGTDTTNQYVVVGVEAGLYLEKSGRLRLLDTESPDLPAEINVDDMKADVRKAPGAPATTETVTPGAPSEATEAPTPPTPAAS
ncbi:hypothetical protein [Parafrankia sp. EUN1f]|uniref:hypothetical protein n=1 Tax=Parafrankia sp. EUN1f TaxID=102897 RepID=UPI0001C43A2D|nr:hypothetical protein [Parafrankia sp. EUN1f]EFC84938.1 hypothetical protein FrEUN1fDRAFT_1987 [Parafrankia sp. EUN1f]